MPGASTPTATPTATRPTIVNVGYRSTNFWVIGGSGGRLLVDLGWPGMIDALLHSMQRAGVPLSDVRYGFATHYHIDHAGAAQDLKQRGMRLVVWESQVAAIAEMKRHIKAADRYTEIVATDNIVMACSASRAWLASLGIAGEVIPTPGHSDDSVSLVLDSGECFVGDLTQERMIGNEDPAVVTQSWDRLRALGARSVYAGHGPIYDMPEQTPASATSSV